ncbi:MAG: hypothetical protein VKS61_01575 [Candidatus Sericytochromatia bacterium]|nr:hypothetical protein [Candidatus Sericytochromatia bacterium]
MSSKFHRRLPLSLALAIALAGCFTTVAPLGPPPPPPGQAPGVAPLAPGAPAQPLTPANSGRPTEADDTLWTLRGRAVLPGGQPLARAEVRLYDADTGTLIGASPLDPVTRTLMEGDPFTYPDGTWHMAFRPLPQGRVYRVVARTDRHTLTTLVSADGRALRGASGKDPLAGYRLQAGGRRPADPVRVETIAGTGQEGLRNGAYREATFKDPQGIAVAPNGTIYVADTGNHVVRTLARGEVTTLAGTGMAGDASGPATTAGFRDPRGLALDASGSTVYVADTGNGRVQAIANGEVTTVALATAAPTPGPTPEATPPAAAPTPTPTSTPFTCNSTSTYNVFGVIKACATNPYAPPPRRPPAKKKYEVPEATTAGQPREDLLGLSLLTATVAPAPLPEGLAPTGVAVVGGHVWVVGDGQGQALIDPHGLRLVSRTTTQAVAVAADPGGAAKVVTVVPERGTGAFLCMGLQEFAWDPTSLTLAGQRFSAHCYGETTAGAVPWKGVSAESGTTGYYTDAHANDLKKWTSVDVQDDLGNNAGRSISAANNMRSQPSTTGFVDGRYDDHTARLNGPAGICLDADGNILFTETGNDAVRKLVLWEPVVPEVVLDVTTTTATVLLDSGRLSYALNDDFHAMFEQATAEQRNAVNAALQSLRDTLNGLPARATADAVDAALFNADGTVASGTTFTQRLNGVSGSLKDAFRALGAYLKLTYEPKADTTASQATSTLPDGRDGAAQVPFSTELGGDAGSGGSGGRRGNGGGLASPPPSPPITSGLFTLFTANASDPSAGTRVAAALLDQGGPGAYDVAVDGVGSAFVSCLSGVAEVTGKAFAPVAAIRTDVTFERLAWGGQPGLFYGAVDGPSVLDGSTVLVNVDTGATLAVSGTPRALYPVGKNEFAYLDGVDGLVIAQADLTATTFLSVNVTPAEATDLARDPNTATYYASEVDAGQDLIRVVKLQQGGATSTLATIPNPDDQPSHLEVHGDWVYVSRTRGPQGGAYASTIYRVKTDGTASDVIAGGDSDASFQCATDDATTPTNGRIAAVSGMAIAPDGKALYLAEHSAPQGIYTYGRVRQLDLP